MTSAKCFTNSEARPLLPSEQSAPALRQAVAPMLFIVVLFRLSPYRDFKVSYLYGISSRVSRLFWTRADRYDDRFHDLMPLFVPLTVLLHGLSGEQEPASTLSNSTKLAVCHDRRIHRHKVFNSLAAHSKTSIEMTLASSCTS